MSLEIQARAEEQRALADLLAAEHVNDLRNQLQAAVEILVRRTGLSHEMVVQLIAKNLEEKRKRP